MASDSAGPVVYVGSRTTRDRAADGVGLTIWRPDADGWAQVGVLAADPTTARGDAPLPANPTFVLVNGDRLYVAHGDTDLVSVLDITDPAAPVVLQERALGRRNPVDLVLVRNSTVGDALVVTCLAGPGGLVGLPVRADGTLGEPNRVVDLTGTPGPMAIQQPGASPHQAVPDPSGRWLLVPDRGLDTIHVVPASAVVGGIAAGASGAGVRVRQGEGPRHLGFHANGRWAYVVTELRSSLLACDWDAETGTLTPRQIVPATDSTVTTDSCAAEVCVTPDGSAVIVSNRSGAGDRVPPVVAEDTLGWFPIGVDGQVGAGRWTPSGGLRPRQAVFAPDGQLVVVNQWDGALSVVDVTPDGLGAPRVVARTGTPTCVAWWTP